MASGIRKPVLDKDLPMLARFPVPICRNLPEADLGGVGVGKHWADYTVKRGLLTFGPKDPACKRRVYGVYMMKYTP